ncbi:uncharacterized protein LOC110026839 [Phalaenopsis equestris]|uniref:uncharacterized protein LOC110026839 n=1 Tax=Phalaenopsis equestris TaxID=78828 RepID=UPI0009E32552|nr:uncharacterized protein LOC110026839 [Phalaenopsis equestris]XP_020583667.1 uncharacterized protein LOC110026839 [Phalaenopsis equestris]XP_020583668.1 uncharacterized protein LOC110026839 [Phalaenopsis equestris]
MIENEDIMAAAEARAAWQRAANRCLVQEDAKRAPKLACCPSSSSFQQNDSSNTDAPNGHDQCASGFMPSSWNFVNSNLPSDTKWWLQMQPSFDYKKDFMFEQLKDLSSEHLNEEEAISQDSFTHEENHGGFTDGEDKKDFPMESSYMASATSMDMKELTGALSQKTLKHKLDIREYYFQKELLDTKPLSSQKKEMAKLDLETPWERSNKCEPWWRVSDREELASFVAQKSLENIENCDLPRPTHICRYPFDCLESWEGNRIFSSLLGCNLDSGMCLPNDYPEQSYAAKEVDGKYLRSDQAHPLPLTTGKQDSDARSSNITAAIAPETQQDSASDPSRTKLLEALCLSQTRARKAELAAQKAYDEKEHIVKLLFKQASHLFAYKQWLQILQLESLFLQLRIKDHQFSSVLPILPWMPLRNKPVTKAGCEGGRRGRKKQKRCRLCKYALLIAVGLGLAGAGLFLGCCFGWFSPNF